MRTLLYTFVVSGLLVQAGCAAEGMEAAVVRAGLHQAPAQILRYQRGHPVQGSHRSVRGNLYKHKKHLDIEKY